MSLFNSFKITSDSSTFSSAFAMRYNSFVAVKSSTSIAKVSLHSSLASDSLFNFLRIADFKTSSFIVMIISSN